MATGDTDGEVEWRRSWKPDLNSGPWRSILVENNVYLLKKRFDKNSYEVLITNSESSWYERLHEKGILKRLQKLNCNLEAPIGKILDHIEKCLEMRNKSSLLSLSEEDDKMLLVINSHLEEISFTWNFVGVPAGNDMISRHLTIPLMMMVSELYRQQQELMKIIHNKDKEIQDYKSQGVKVSRKYMETSTFDERSFLNSMILSKGFENQVHLLGTSTFESPCQQLYQQIMTKHAWLNRDPTSLTELESNSDDDFNQSSQTTGPSWTNRLPPSFSQIISREMSPDSKKRATKTPTKCPDSCSTSPESETEQGEALRRQILEKRLALEKAKKDINAKKKKKLAF